MTKAEIIESYLNFGDNPSLSVRYITKSSSTFSATSFISYIKAFFQLHDTIEIKWNYAWIHYNIALRGHLMI